MLCVDQHHAGRPSPQSSSESTVSRLAGGSAPGGPVRDQFSEDGENQRESPAPHAGSPELEKAPSRPTHGAEQRCEGRLVCRREWQPTPKLCCGSRQTRHRDGRRAAANARHRGWCDRRDWSDGTISPSWSRLRDQPIPPQRVDLQPAGELTGGFQAIDRTGQLLDQLASGSGAESGAHGTDTTNRGRKAWCMNS